jgi:hypothetical protein
MTEVPKIVHDRLRAASEQTCFGQTHPDTNLLAAFAEQALAITEREGILEHLALCGDCRAVVALALPAETHAPLSHEADGVGKTVSPARTDARHWLRFERPGLRWAALAAGVAVVVVALLVRPVKLNLAILPSASQKVAPSTSGTLASSRAANHTPVLAKAEDAQTKAASPSEDLRAGQAVTGSRQVESDRLLATNRKQLRRSDKMPGLPSSGASIFDYASTSRGATEAVAVSAGASEAARQPSLEGTLVARNEAPAIEKAKPVPQEIEAELNEAPATQAAVAPGPAKLPVGNMMTAAKASRASQNSVPSVAWTITAGVLQRSLDSGASWQNALHPDHALLCYASHGEDVWAGGQAGSLFHSIDNGVTWVKVAPYIKADQLSSDITHIDVNSAAEIVVATANHEVWSTVDGGNNWNMK